MLYMQRNRYLHLTGLLAYLLSQGRRAKKSSGRAGAPASFPFLPPPFSLLSLSLSSPPLPSFSLPLEVGPLIAAKWSGRAL